MRDSSAGGDLYDGDCLVIGVAGQEAVTASAVRLYPYSIVSEWRGLLAQAQEMLGGAQSIVGAFGSPGVVLGTALAVGIIEGLVASANAQEGRKSLQIAAKTYDTLRRAARSFPVREIANLDLAQPSSWSAKHNGETYVLLGEDFIGVELREGGLMQLRWSLVASYRAIVDGRAAEPPVPVELMGGPDPAAHFLG